MERAKAMAIESSEIAAASAGQGLACGAWHAVVRGGLGMRWCDVQVCEHAVQRACGGVSFVGADIAERREDWRMARCRRRESHILQTCSL